ncbi:hypothetical protein ASPTUDRAFT_791000 [Aspergillus tubingensis CBS 134.48]|uniref:Uncharacterized protein n=1 Tax=Aspergillus tubingensis (strain CBS 134.48) TaxID=767770 RepID=A0A1L9MVE9_ASPTC|nr:hypothetical protein ASPTUDRAFT_791000 [Aspergillus tubingensis CBS 134.48]
MRRWRERERKEDRRRRGVRMEKKRVRGASTSTFSSSSASSALLPLLLLLLLSPLLNIASWHHTASNPKEFPPALPWLAPSGVPSSAEFHGSVALRQREDNDRQEENLSSTTQQSARNSCADTGLDVVLHCRRDGGTVVIRRLSPSPTEPTVTSPPSTCLCVFSFSLFCFSLSPFISCKTSRTKPYHTQALDHHMGDNTRGRVPLPWTPAVVIAP